APALRFSASFRLAFQEVAAIQQASPASAGQKRPGSAPRPSSASSKRAVAAAAAAYPAAPLSPYAQKLGGGGGGGNESASLAAARRRDQEQRLAAVRRANEQHRQRMQQQQQKEREQDEAKRRQQREEALINAAQTPTPPPAAAVAASPSPSPSPSPRGGDYAAYHAALDNLAKEAQHRPRQSPQPQQQQLHPGVAVPSSSPSASPTPPPAADNQSERAQRLLEDYWERKRLAARIKAQGLGLGAAQAVNPLSPRPAAVAVEETYLRRLEEVRRRNQRERQQLGEDVQQERHAAPTAAAEAASPESWLRSAPAAATARQHPRTPATEMIRKLRRDEKKESILRYINRKGEPPSVPQQQPPPPDAGVRSAWDSVDSDVDRLDRLPLRLQGSDSSSASADSPTSPQAPTAAPSSARQTPRAWGARADDTGFLRRLGNAPILSGTLVDSDRLPEQEVDGEGEVDGKADSESVKSPAHSDLSQVETAEASAAAATAAAALVESSPSISDASASTGHSLLDQVAFEPDAERPQKEASANSVDNEKPGKSGATAGKGGVDLERTDMQLAIYQSLKDFALSAATTAAATDDEVEAAEQLLLSSLTLEEAEELAEVERSFHRVLNDPEPSPSDAKDDDTKAEADDAQCSRTLKQALTSGKFDSPKSLLRTCSLPDLVDGADAGASGEISADSTATVVSVEAASLPSRPRQRPASSSAAAVAAAATPNDNDDVVVLDGVNEDAADADAVVEDDDEELDQVKQSMASVLALSAEAGPADEAGLRIGIRAGAGPSVSEVETERRVKSVLSDQHSQLYDKIMTLLFYDNPN
uniref:WW domain-containing protein n=1 Tax=Macrostomum lignano TaxID=282301 RepID=A0A1I8IXB2_9PLAT